MTRTMIILESVSETLHNAIGELDEVCSPDQPAAMELLERMLTELDTYQFYTTKIRFKRPQEPRKE